MDVLIETMIAQDLQKCFKHYGVEGTEQVIKGVYVYNISLREAYLKTYNKLVFKTGRVL